MAAHARRSSSDGDCADTDEDGREETEALVEPESEELVQLTRGRGEQNDERVHGKAGEGESQRRASPGTLKVHYLCIRLVASVA